jgi:hypothetical protein
MGKCYFELPATKSGEEIQFDHDSLMKRYLGHIPDGTKLSVKVSKLGKPKSHKQLGYYRAVILPEVYRQMLCDGHTITTIVNGKEFERPITEYDCHLLLKSHNTTVSSMSDMKSEEASDFIDNCIVWSAINLGLSIDPPKK